MKKFIVFLFTILFGFVLSVNAQIKITNTQQNRVVEVKTLDFGETNKLLRSGNDYIYAITQTTNRFDKPMLLLLGSDKEEILYSLNVLYSTIDTIGDEEIITIDNGFGSEYKLSKWVVSEKDMAKLQKLAKLTKTELEPCFIVNSKEYAGYGTILKSALKSAIDYFNE